MCNISLTTNDKVGESDHSHKVNETPGQTICRYETGQPGVTKGTNRHKECVNYSRNGGRPRKEAV
jgi:hypothetical protein